MTTTHSEALFERAQKVIPGGVNSPVRSFRQVGGTPLFFKKGYGAYVVDVDDNVYVDYVNSWGTAILGHCHPAVVKAIQDMATQAISFGAPTEWEVMLAEQVCTRHPGIETLRCVNSGTEATMTAIRLARGVTSRDLIIKFQGGYHGHHDSLLLQAGSGALGLGKPSSAGIPEKVVQDTINLAFNDLVSLTEAFEQYGDRIAAVIVEPIAANMNLVLGTPAFLSGIIHLCKQYGALSIFDEVITGFRVHYAGAQGLYGLQPDLTTFGKIIGGGLPVGAIGGKASHMAHLSPLGPVYQAGTLSGNPLAMAAGLAQLSLLTPDAYERLSKTTYAFVHEFETLSKEYGIPMVFNQCTGLFGFYFTEQPQVTSFAEVMACDHARFRRFFHALCNKGVYFAPSACEAGFISMAHGAHEFELTLEAIRKIFQTGW